MDYKNPFEYKVPPKYLGITNPLYPSIFESWCLRRASNPNEPKYTYVIENFPHYEPAFYGNKYSALIYFRRVLLADYNIDLYHLYPIARLFNVGEEEVVMRYLFNNLDYWEGVRIKQISGNRDFFITHI